MIIYNSSQPYIRPAVKIGTKQQLSLSDLFNRSGGLAVWRAVGKIMLPVLPVILAINLFVGSAVDSANHSIVILDSKYQELEDKNIDLLAQKALVWGPDNVKKVAGKLSLYKTDKKQVGWFNRRTGTFSYL